MSSPVLPPAARLRGLKPDWLRDPRAWRTEVLAGLVVALALIPEAISFSVIAGVDPAIGLFASFIMAVTIAVVGGRRAMISAATDVVALVIAPLNREHGLGHLVAAVILAIGVVVGSVTAMVAFAKRVAHLAEVTAVIDPDGSTVVYQVTGEPFFASSHDLVGQFNYATDPDRVVIDLPSAHIWDASSIAALDAIETKYAQRGKQVEITGLNEPSAHLHGKLSGEFSASL